MSKFKDGLHALSVAFNKELDIDQVKLYKRLLEKYPDQEFLLAVKKIIETDKYFPTISRIVEVIEGEKGDIPLIAYRKVLDAIAEIGPYKSIKFQDSAINKAIAELGGWVAINMKTLEELGYMKKDFIALYKFYSQYKDVYSDVYLPGIAEKENHLKGLEHKEKPILILCEWIERKKQLQTEKRKELKE